MKRRTFFNWVGVGSLATSLPIALAACQDNNESTADAGGDSDTGSAANPTSEPASEPAPEPASEPESEPTPEPVDSTPREDGFTAIGRVSDLDAAGSINNEALSVAAIRDPNNAEAVLAVNALCTHQGCTVDWKASEAVFVCPCHASKFGADGRVVSGVADRPLPTYDAKIEADLVLVKLS